MFGLDARGRFHQVLQSLFFSTELLSQMHHLQVALLQQVDILFSKFSRLDEGH